MEPTVYMEITAIIIGVWLLAIGLIDYARCKLRKYGENPPKLLSIFKRGK